MKQHSSNSHCKFVNDLLEPCCGIRSPPSPTDSRATNPLWSTRHRAPPPQPWAFHFYNPPVLFSTPLKNLLRLLIAEAATNEAQRTPPQVDSRVLLGKVDCRHTKYGLGLGIGLGLRSLDTATTHVTMPAPIVYDGVPNEKYEGTLFNGVKFWVGQRVPSRNTLLDQIKAGCLPSLRKHDTNTTPPEQWRQDRASRKAC